MVLNEDYNNQLLYLHALHLRYIISDWFILNLYLGHLV